MKQEQKPPEPSPFDDGELYDLLFQDFTYGLDFYLALAQQAQGPILDIACGTGRILLPCLQAGLDVDGLDLYPGMLNTLRSKAAALGFQPSLHQADMSVFALPRRYALIMIPFNAFGHNVTQDAQIRCLENCRRHLMPGGLLAFDAFFPGLHIIGAEQGTRVLEMEGKHPVTRLPFRIFDTRSFDRVQQIQHSINELELLDAQGAVATTHRSEFDMRWVYKEEMALLLRVAGFAHWDIFADFERRPLTRETDGMVVVAG